MYKASETPLHLAVKGNALEVAALLIEKGANINALNDVRIKTFSFVSAVQLFSYL